MNIFTLSQQNGSYLEESLKSIPSHSSGGESTILGFFEEVRHHGRISINMRPWIAADLLHRDRYLNVHESAHEDSNLTGRDEDDLLKEKLGIYYGPRINFDDTFENGRKFRYGALNTGGAGITRYGSFCIVLHGDFPSSGEPTAYLRHDSLHGYIDADGTVNRTIFQHDLACDSHRHHLATLKHVHELESRKEEWPMMLCSNKDYMEAIFVTPISGSSVSEVRVLASEYEMLWDLCFAAYGRRLSDAEKAIAHDFRQIVEAVREKGLTLSVIPDA